MIDDAPAAIRATFSDFKLVRTRKTCQLVLEIPIEEADNALDVLGGIPQPQSDCWVAVARLNGVAKTEPKPKEKRKWDDLKLSTQAGMRCEEKAFQRFLEDSCYPPNAVGNGEEAAELVKALCGVDSRSKLNENREAADIWRDLDRSYQAWLKAAE